MPISVDIWLTRTAEVDASLVARYQDLLDPAERSRMGRYLVPEARRQFLVARALLRTVLSRYADVAPQDWAFATDIHGKPFIASPEYASSLKFNVSHTEGLIACTVAQGREIGVDVEFTGKELDWLLVGKRVFAAEEQAGLRHLPVGEQRDRFFSLWTLKESYLKARGAGLTLPLDGFWFDLQGSTPQISFSERCPDDPQRWWFARLNPTPEHHLALALADAPGASVDLHWVVPLA